MATAIGRPLLNRDDEGGVDWSDMIRVGDKVRGDNRVRVRVRVWSSHSLLICISKDVEKPSLISN